MNYEAFESLPQPDHYKAPVSPIEIIEANNLGFHEGNILKYVLRYKAKGGVEDLRKARWYLDRLIALEKKLLP